MRPSAAGSRATRSAAHYLILAWMAEVFTLLEPETVRMQLPALPMAGGAEPMHIHLD